MPNGLTHHASEPALLEHGRQSKEREWPATNKRGASLAPRQANALVYLGMLSSQQRSGKFGVRVGGYKRCTRSLGFDGTAVRASWPSGDRFLRWRKH